nr:hypothetical protein pPsy0479a_00103 [Pseudomonas syringae]
MRTQPNAQENSATFLTPPVQPRMPWRVTSIQVLPHFRLSVCFVDGTQGIIDLSNSVHSPMLECLLRYATLCCLNRLM